MPDYYGGRLRCAGHGVRERASKTQAGVLPHPLPENLLGVLYVTTDLHVALLRVGSVTHHAWGLLIDVRGAKVSMVIELRKSRLKEGEACSVMQEDFRASLLS